MRYRILGQHSGLRVSQVALGTGNFGTAWGYGADAVQARAVFERVLEVTADNYQSGESETLLGGLVGRRQPGRRRPDPE